MGVKCDSLVLTSSDVIVIVSFIASRIVDLGLCLEAIIMLTIYTIIITTILSLILYEFGGFRHHTSFKETLANVAQGSLATSLSSRWSWALCH